eukprot:CAMPEP_0198139928 /NCGR_PEP_ID=MMETSP1443-20131203/3162_1 /TAXON_ID=186043 /ORGANISM="Entomoneis sp., Strain CCMP2396" /LENGTH=180 /DNA_ID=CAMNT_0043802197 /DNA_START=40 /DNA_END=579 /DNA_ORIENTATION=-
MASSPLSSPVLEKIVIVYGGELAQDVAEQIKAKQQQLEEEKSPITVELRSAGERPKALVDYCKNDKNDATATAVLFCFVMQTIENSSPTEDGGITLRFFKRKTHPESLLSSSDQQLEFQFCVLGLGDSNLLMDRQTTTAKDCNQVAQELDQRLASLGGTRFMDICQADERTGLQPVVDPW